MPHADFWQVSLREYDLITRAKINAKNAEFDAWRVLNQEMAVLIKFAFNDPNNMPDFTKSGKAKPTKEIGGKKGAAILRLHMERMYQNSQRGR